VTGHASIGAGWPGVLSGDVSVSRDAGTSPGFSIDATHASSSGSVESGVKGFWVRDTTLSGCLESGKSRSDWSAALSIREKADGFQGKADGYSGLVRRNVDFSGSTGAFALGSTPILVKTGLSGSVFSSIADGSDPALPAAAIADYAGYRLSPTVAFLFVKDAFSARFDGSYGYDAVSSVGEVHAGDGTLSLGYRLNRVRLSASAGFHADSVDGPLVPFTLSAEWSDGGVPSGPVRFVRLSGGLDSARSSPFRLAERETWAALSGNTVYSADWNGAVSAGIAPAKDVSVDFGAAYRTSAFGRGVLAVTDMADSTMRYTVARTTRQSLMTSAKGSWARDFWSLSAGYEGEWLDRLWRQSLQTVSAKAAVHDPGARRIWDASASASFALDVWQVPVLGLYGALRPARNVAVEFRLDDAVPLVTARSRALNSLYSSTDGALSVSVRVDF